MVAVVGAGALDEPVVEVVEDGRREHAIEAEDSRVLVELVLVAAAARDLDDDLDAGPETRAPSSDRLRGELAGEAAIDRIVLGVAGHEDPHVDPPRGLVVVQAFLDELLLHRPAVRVEAGELEVLLELDVDVVRRRSGSSRS